MIYELSQTFMFDAAHTLSRSVPLAEYTPSRRIHGHTFTAEVAIRGSNGAAGMLQVRNEGRRITFKNVDLFVLQGVIAKVRALLDHQFLDEVEGLGAPTLENLCKFIAERAGQLLPIHSVTVSRAAGDKCRLLVSKDHT